MANVLDRRSILAAEDVKVVECPVPEWGGVVMVKSMTGQERDELENLTITARQAGKTEEGLANFRARVVALAACDPDGDPLFDADDIPALGRKSAKALQRVYDLASKMAGITPGDEAELVGNSGETPTGGSTSA